MNASGEDPKNDSRSGENRPHDTRLNGWKSIGSFLGCDARTARRWEAERGLPVHRVPGGGSATVWAFEAELSAWMQGTELGSDAPANPAAAPGQEASAKQSFFKRRMGITLLAASAAGIALFAAPALITMATSTQANGQPTLAPYGADQAANASYEAAQYAMQRRSVAGLLHAEETFNGLAQQYPRNPAAYVGLAETNLLLREFNSLPDETAYRRAANAAQQALNLDSRSAGALRSLAFVRYWSDGETAEGLQLFERALRAKPNDSQTQHWYGTALLGEGRFADALQALDRARALQPASSAIAADIAYVQYLSGDRRLALSALRRITEVEPEFSGAHTYLERFYLVEGRDEEFLAEAAISARLKRDTVKAELIAQATAAYQQGGRAAMLRLLIDDAQAAFTQNGETALDLARYYAAAGDRRQVLAWLGRAESIRQPEVRSLIAYADFVPYRNDPAFARFFNQR